MPPIPPPWKTGTWSATEYRPWSKPRKCYRILGYKRSEVRGQIAEVKAPVIFTSAICPLTSALAPLRHKLVSRTVHGAKVRGVRGILFQLLPQSQDVIIDCPRARIIPISPNVVQ